MEKGKSKKDGSKVKGKYTLIIRLPEQYQKMLFEASNQEGESFNTIVKNALKKHLAEGYGIDTRAKA